MERPKTDSPRFEEHYTDAVQTLRAALIESYQSSGADSESPRDAARTLGIDKTLTWKLGRIINEESIERVASSIPGANAVQLAVEAFERAGVDQALVKRVRDAFLEFDQMVEIHTGDREALGLLLDSMAFSGSDRLVKSRKLAFRGNSGIWGAQSRMRVNTSIIAPNRENPTKLDYAQIGGYVDLQRLRAEGSWPLFRFRYHNDDGTDMSKIEMRTLIDEVDPQRPHLLTDFGTGRNPEISSKEVQSGLLYELHDGPVGRTGLCSTFYGYTDAASLSRYQDEHNTIGEVLCLINLPIESLMMDLLVHRDVADKINPEGVVYGRSTGGLNEHEHRDRRSLLPIHESIKMLGLNPMLATPHVSRYTELVNLAFDRCGFDSTEFVAWRLSIPYPPMTSTVSIRFELPSQPS